MIQSKIGNDKLKGLFENLVGALHSLLEEVRLQNRQHEETQVNKFKSFPQL